MSPTLLAPEPTATRASTQTTTRPIAAPITPESIEAARRLAAEVAIKVKQDLRMGREHQEGRINWITAIVMGLFHVGAVAALFCFSWTHLAVACFTYFFAINVGIGMAYHRLLTQIRRA